ncbi:MAG: nicotinamide-nucleotide adenylyltransferase [Candidatus Methylarchaceae archaeon HK01B]|nr:nicotinamide-nucleotide adenylyltransferase [Candidatus Methylarchaceae archaeon HK01B]
MIKRGLFIGRFQPFHKGHLRAVKNLLDKVEELIILVGSSQCSHTLDNPFTTGERIMMIRLALNESNIEPHHYIILPVPDVEMHSTWVSHVISYSPKFEITFSNEPLTRHLFTEAGFKVESIPFYKRETLSATEIRKRMLSRGDWEELVPRSVAQFIKQIGGVERIINISKNDNPY